MANPDPIAPGLFAVHRDQIDIAAKLYARVQRNRFKADSDYDDDDDAPDGDRDDDFADELGEEVAKQTLDAARYAVIPIRGVLMRGVAGLECWGLCDYETVADSVEDADNDDNIDAIILVVDSPGGGVQGCQEAAARIAAVSKPVLVFTSGMLCSAAYWLTSSAEMIIATPSSAVGSIGVYRTFWDQSAAFDQMGVKVQVFSSGALKGAGQPGTSLTDTQTAEIQKQVDAVAGDFWNEVLTNRPAVDLSLMDGRDVRGKEAVDLGLADLVVNEFGDAVSAFLATI